MRGRFRLAAQPMKPVLRPLRFRTVLIATFSLLVVGMLGASLTVVVRVLESAARSDISDDLHRTRQAFEELQSYRQSLFASEASVLTEEPRIKAVIASEETTPETIEGVALEVNASLKSDLLVFANAGGHVLSEIRPQGRAPKGATSLRALSDALGSGVGSEVWVDGDRVYQVQARRVAFGDTVYGAIAVGHWLDDGVVTSVQRQTASTVVVALDGKIIATSPFDGASPSQDELAAVSARLPALELQEVSLAGTRYLALSAPFPGHDSSHVLRYVALRSLDRALAPARRLTHVLFGVFGLAVVLALALAAVLAARLSRPVDELVTLTKQFASGKLGARAVPHGPVELQALAESMNRMAGDLEEAENQIRADRERLRSEMVVAMHIQRALLPSEVSVPGLEIAEAMVPLSAVSGDYYDVTTVSDGCWLGMGDVAGHGVTAGIIMMMVQGVMSTVVRSRPDGTPSEQISLANRLLTHTIRDRLKCTEHVTLTLLRYYTDGRVVFAGAHEEIIHIPASGGPPILHATPGTWIGQIDEISGLTKDSELRLADQDILVLHTDGITEARNRERAEFGLDRLLATIEATRTEPAQVIRDTILEAVSQWSNGAPQTDDMSLVVLRYRAPTT